MQTFSYNTFVCFLTIFITSWIQFAFATPSIITSTNDVTFEVNSSGHFSLSLSEKVQFPVYIHFNYTPRQDFNIVPLPNTFVFENNSVGPLFANVTAYIAGHTIVSVNTIDKEIHTDNAFIRVSVYKSFHLNIFSDVIGWLYFIFWSVSFYPQIISNWKRKSVVGLNFDFLGLNLTGFIAYSVFNVGLRFFDEVKNEYHSLNPQSVIPVQINDVVFALHAVFATAVCIGQCFIYERGDQLISRTTVAALALVWSTAGVFLLITALGVNPYTPWLTYLYFFSYVKLLVTLTKYIPQAFYNYKRKSTVGWSIGTVLADFVGGVFSILQMFIIAYNYNDWHSLAGNLTKFGLGAASMSFDIIFMVQHYCLYRGAKNSSMRDLLVTNEN